MARLIDADALVEEIGKEIDEAKKAPLCDYCAGMKNVIGIVKNQDTVDPVKHGRWVDTGRADYYLNKEYRCSCCNSVDYMSSPYCYNCGARMDGEQNVSD